MSQLEDLYTATLRGAERTERSFMFKGERLSAQSTGDGLVYVWFELTDEDIDNKFNARELSEDELIDEVANWVRSVDA